MLSSRRGFLSSLVGGVAAAAAVRTFPFRVFSFPTEVVKPVGYMTYILGSHAIFYDAQAVEILKRKLKFGSVATLHSFTPAPKRVHYFRYREVDGVPA